MTIFEKIQSIYPEITERDIMVGIGTIVILEETGIREPYIAAWNHPTLPRPTDEQLAGVQ